jgi:hypothetical protein
MQFHPQSRESNQPDRRESEDPLLKCTDLGSILDALNVPFFHTFQIFESIMTQTDHMEYLHWNM